VRGYKEEGTTTTPFDMCVLNDLDDRFHETCVMELMVWWRIPRLRLAKRGAGSWQDGGG
jgi:xylulose-5-phosphate/fructose-6-phosphate phosphoketolase